ncbi:MAG: hypothetical protein HZB30_09840 [Nitrospirae bacterium]|nr:hypothetical protein [Nitrospirota bacterium]
METEKRRMAYSILVVLILMVLLVVVNRFLTKDIKGDKKPSIGLEQPISKSKATTSGSKREFRDSLLDKGELEYYKTKRKFPAYRITITNTNEHYKYLSETLGLDFEHIDASIPLDERHLAWTAKLLAASQTWNLKESQLRDFVNQNQLMLDLFNQIQIKYLSNEIDFSEYAIAVKKLQLWNEAYYMEALSNQQYKDLNFGTSKDEAPQAIENVLTPPVTELSNMFPGFEKDFKNNEDILTILTQEQLDRLVIAEKAKWLKETTLNSKFTSKEITQDQYQKEKEESIRVIEAAKIEIVGQDIYSKYLDPGSVYTGSNIQGEPPPGVAPENYKDYVRN